jgi:hypothetical protein
MSEALGVNYADGVVALSPHDELVAKVDFTIERARRALLAQQHPAGYWQGLLEAHAEMNAEYIIFNRFMELPRTPNWTGSWRSRSSRLGRATVLGRYSRAARATSRPRSRRTSD